MIHNKRKKKTKKRIINTKLNRTEQHKTKLWKAINQGKYSKINQSQSKQIKANQSKAKKRKEK